ncbi:hypothetical protein GGX14DRAFT_384087 [Mycena pura]|uniref:Uncharacterized protein n=1 Tax=Mycena pura TaxID=153505 RepID=A0AAD6YVI1_9AGAR|nr:hypothetical protein GGX14DRAFT_384087 [Mycena pura]
MYDIKATLFCERVALASLQKVRCVAKTVRDAGAAIHDMAREKESLQNAIEHTQIRFFTNKSWSPGTVPEIHEMELRPCFGLCYCPVHTVKNQRTGEGAVRSVATGQRRHRCRKRTQAWSRVYARDSGCCRAAAAICVTAVRTRCNAVTVVDVESDPAQVGARRDFNARRARCSAAPVVGVESDPAHVDVAAAGVEAKRKGAVLAPERAGGTCCLL